jgi:hypothetical protein
MREEEFMQEQEARMRRMQAETDSTYASQLQQSMALEEQDKGILREQLDLSEELERIEHLLKGEILVKQEDGSRDWVKAPNEDMEVLSEEGIHLILSTIQWYINKNTLLSNYDEDTILQKMEDFSITLNDALFMAYEKYFKMPTLDACKNVIRLRIERKAEIKEFAGELVGLQLDKEQIKKELLKEMEGRIEVELEKVREQLMKNKLKRFELIMRVVQDAVHSTYLRAYKGMERRTLREHIQVTENKGNFNQPPKRKGIGDMLGWKRN